jgi:hypothetical protein
MRIVEEKSIAADAPPMLANSTHEIGLVPLVNQNDRAPVKRLLEVEALWIVAARRNRRKCLASCLQRLLAVVGDEVLNAPRVARLVDADAMTASAELGHDPPEKVRIAVIPVAQ